MDTATLIKMLHDSGLYAECPCGKEFKISDAFLFDGTKPFPSHALEIQARLKQELKDKEEELKKSKKLATEKAGITAKSVNIGKNFEKVLPTLKDYKWALSDSRFLGDPVDIIVFNGVSTGKIDSISFVEAKTGKSRLNAHQKAVKDAVDDHKVVYKELK